MMFKDKFVRLESDFYDIYRQFPLGKFAESCERSWTNLLLYMPVYDWHSAVINDRLWIASFKASYIFFPAGGIAEPAELAGVLKEFAAVCPEKAVCGDVPEDYLQRFPEAEKFFDFEIDPGEADYIYDLEHLASFSGSKLRKRHNQLRQFEREYEGSFRLEKMDSGHLPQVYALAEKLSGAVWATDSGAEERSAMQRLDFLWSDPNCRLGGVLLYVQDLLAGFSIYSPIAPGIADIHFEKADHAFTGSGTKLTAGLTGQLLAENFRYMNREQDLNVEGLRRAKRSLDPDHCFERASITLL